MKPIRLIAVDMDGTLLDSQGRLPAGLYSLVRELTGRGIRFVIASGRQYYNLESLFHPLADCLTFVAENGAAVFEKGRLLSYDEMRREDVRDLLAEAAVLPGIVPGLCGVQATYIDRIDPELEKKIRLYYDRLERVDNLAEALERDRICKVTYYVPEAAESVAYPALCKRYPALKVTLSGKHWVDVTNSSAHKGSAIAFLQRRDGLVPDECMAFGDYLNDVEMMRVCGQSYGMKNGHPDLLACCRFVTAKTNDEDGVCDTLRTVFGLA